MGALARTMGSKTGQNTDQNTGQNTGQNSTYTDANDTISAANGTSNKAKTDWGKSVANMFEKGGSWDHSLRHEFAQLVSDREKEQEEVRQLDEENKMRIQKKREDADVRGGPDPLSRGVCVCVCVCV